MVFHNRLSLVQVWL